MADNETAGTSDEEATAALENALAGEQNVAPSAESATATTVETETPNKGTPQAIPYNRFLDLTEDI